MPRKSGLTEQQLLEMEEMYLAGCTTRELGVHFGVSHQTAAAKLASRGVSMRPSGARLGVSKRQYLTKEKRKEVFGD